MAGELAGTSPPSPSRPATPFAAASAAEPARPAPAREPRAAYPPARTGTPAARAASFPVIQRTCYAAGMDVVSAGPLRVASVVWQPRPGAWALTAIIKATYRLEPLRSPLAEVQEAPSTEDNHWDDDPAKSLYAASDMVPFKRRPEVLLVGHAFAPGGKPVRSLLARMQVGEVDKAIEVWCDRVFSQEGQLLEGRAFTKMPLRWERAAGGPGTWNPVGMRFDAAPDMYGSLPVPNLQPPGRLLAWRGDSFEPIGFGPLAPTWPLRAGQLSLEAAARWASMWFAQPLTDGPDAGFFSVAPPDQRTEELRPDERIVLENLHPVHARLVTNLAELRPRAVVERATGEREELRLVADTLSIDTDRSVATLVWRGSVGLRDRVEVGRVVVWAESLGAAPVPVVTPQEEPDDDEDAIRTIIPPAVSARHGGAGEAPEEEDEQVVRTAPAPLGIVGGAKVLPFHEGAPVIEPAAGKEPEIGRLAAALAAPGSTLAAPLAASAATVLPFDDIGAAPKRSEQLAEVPRLTAGAGIGAPPPWGAPPERAVAAPAPASPLEPETRELPPPPPMIGPLATSEMLAPGAVQEEATNPIPPRDPSSGEVESAPAAPTAARPEVSLERCATITARIARTKARRDQILGEEGLSADDWADIERHWADSIRSELSRGKQSQLRRFDAAYLQQIELERGTIEPSDYARLMVASERGNIDEALLEMGLPRGSIMRIERVWMQRMAEDPALGERVRDAAETTRGST